MSLWIKNKLQKNIPSQLTIELVMNHPQACTTITTWDMSECHKNYEMGHHYDFFFSLPCDYFIPFPLENCICDVVFLVIKVSLLTSPYINQVWNWPQTAGNPIIPLKWDGMPCKMHCTHNHHEQWVSLRITKATARVMASYEHLSSALLLWRWHVLWGFFLPFLPFLAQYGLIHHINMELE